MYKQGYYNGFYYRVNKDGDCFLLNKKGEWTHREWRYNKDGYAVVTGVQWKQGKPTAHYRTIAVHILVARAFVVGYFPGAEVNHKDFNRANPKASNLEWVTHAQNVHYSYVVGHYVGRFGERNPNYGNDTLHRRYMEDKSFAKEKQSRPGGQNGKAIKCWLQTLDKSEIYKFDFQRAAVSYLIERLHLKEDLNKETLIKWLKRPKGYLGWQIIQIKK